MRCRQPGRWACSTTGWKKRLSQGLKIEEIVVDYSQLENTVNGRVGWRSIMNGADASKLRGKLVLIGDAYLYGAAEQR